MGPENPNFGKPAIDWADIDIINKATNLVEAKKLALEILDKSTANSKNKTNITTIINKANSLKALMLSLGNLALAHPRENLKLDR